MDKGPHDYYAVLGVTRFASAAEIRTAYRKIVLQHHPDRSPSLESARIFLEAGEAYEVLNSEVRRNEYNRILDLDYQIQINKTKTRPAPQPEKPRTETTVPKAKTQPERKIPRPTEDLLRLTGLLARARYVEAEKLARKLIRSHPNQAIPHAVLGDIARYRGDLHEAVEEYALASQLDPGNALYFEKYEEISSAQSSMRQAKLSVGKADTHANSAIALGSLITGFCAVFVALSTERPSFVEIPIINTWTTGLVVMLAVAGIVMGAALSYGGVIERFSTAFATGTTSLPPAAALGVLSAVSFWLAAAVYIFVAATQNAFNLSTSRLVGSGALMTLAFTGACFVHKQIDPIQTFALGGNIIYVAMLLGWVFTDSLGESR